MQIWGHTPMDASSQCWKCKHRLRRLTGGCRILAIATGVMINSMYDDIYGCNEFEPLKEKTK